MWYMDSYIWESKHYVTSAEINKRLKILRKVKYCKNFVIAVSESG